MASARSANPCPMASLLQTLMGPWTTYILWVLRRDGPQRFGTLRRALSGISAKVLTERLRLLERQKIIYRLHAPTIPPAVTYGLDTRGLELSEILDRLNAVAQTWREEDAPASALHASPVRWDGSPSP
jgi:DNA-binding HxlR family transcriptional regulator